MSDPSHPAPRIKPWTIWVPIIVMVLGVVVLYNYLIHEQQRQSGAEKDRPAFLRVIDSDLVVTERSGKEVHFSELRGKILLVSWVFTRCPRGCAGVIAKLKKLHEEYGNNPDIHFVSFTLDPDDTPALMDKFASGLGITSKDNWWFVNGPKDKVRNFLTKYVTFYPVRDIPESDRMSPDDKYLHDLRVALVDHKGHVRGLHDIMNLDQVTAKFWDEKIRKDLNYLLAEKKSGK